MAKTIHLEIVTPDRKLLSEDVEFVGAPGYNGEFGVLPDHAPFLSALGVGSLHYNKDGRTYWIFLSGGFAEVSGNKMSVLAEVAERAEEIDAERARKAKDRAEKRMIEQKAQIDFARTQAALQRALARMKTKNMVA
ncbi:ATP synthase F1 subcomplex epsilon subunit [Desulfonatronum thiosulfatophilum]|uniref:ATP synthase epsilon chain n=1 Tax=Desulfonatronum thiosulfatophilum TaxID=617002 RepID=A0A1G6C386_9BACT|nr:F0F1 ATP synthase subunit epsilon [Desulfonatronum thiosulfatophilum]SDB27327.1 ATP synthase F1 subcomplex epsilon subunit [Desulfonatronum thiosulfatophilum]